MKKLLLILFTFHSSLFTLSAQSWLWARQGRNGGLDENANMSIAQDNFHNIYEAGKMGGDTLILQTDTLFATGGGVEALLIKYDENGNFLWAQHSNKCTNTFAQVSHVTTDSHNNVYIAGIFQDSIYFPPYSLKSTGNPYSSFIVKYNSSGNILWAKQSKSGGLHYDAGIFGSATDNFGNTYVTGLFGDTVIFDGDTIKTNGDEAFFLAKYDSSGNFKWIRQATNNSIYGLTNGYSVITDNKGNIYCTGAFEDTIAFDSQVLKSRAENAFLAKYDSSGNLIWVKQTSTPSASSDGTGGGVCLDVDGNIYVSGYFFDTLYVGTTTLVNPNNQWYDVFWAKYDSSGNALWAKQAYSFGNPTCQLTSWLIVTDNARNIYLRANMAVNSPPQEFKIVFGNDTLQLSKAYDAAAWVKFDSTGSNVLAGYIFPTGGGWLEDPFAVDSSGCYVYFGGDAEDTTIVISNDTIGTNSRLTWPFVARWTDGECTTGITPVKTHDLVVNLYPNPNNGKFTLVIASEAKQSLNKIEVYNVLGEKVYDVTLKQVQGGNSIDITGQASGVYLYRIINQQGSQEASGKFIIL